MKYGMILMLALFISSCAGEQKPKQVATSSDSTATEKIAPPKVAPASKDISWTGSLNNKIPIFVHYQFYDELVVGEITYLNTVGKEPIRLIGKKGEENMLYLTEYDKAGNITGSISGQVDGNSMKGYWYAPNSGEDKTFDLLLERKDTSIQSRSIEAQPSDIFGTYNYQYGEAGYQGDFTLTKREDDKVSFELISVTREPARNIAELNIENLKIEGTHFNYKESEVDNCAIDVQFYDGFAEIRHPEGMSCMGYFGHNATAAGIFIKTK